VTPGVESWPEPRGALDQPAPGSIVERGVVAIAGWALFPSGPTARVDLWLGGRPLGRARLGMHREDVRIASGNPLGRVSGFELIVNLAELPMGEGESSIRIGATCVDGTRLDLPEIPIRISGAAPATELPPRTAEVRTSPGTDRLRVLVGAHDLDLGGAQLQLLELLEGLLRLGVVEPLVLSTGEGPLRARFEDLGAPVHLRGVVPVDDAAVHRDAVEELVAWARGRRFDLFLVNTVTSHSLPVAEAAGALGIPAAWLIHESFEPAQLFAAYHPAVRRAAEEALAGASAAIFENDLTKALYEPLIPTERAVTLPYGLDLEAIEARRAGFDRAAARSRAGISDDADVIVCLGGIEPRKAQVPLALAFDRIARLHPRARLALVGGRRDEHTRFLEEVVANLDAGERIGVVPMTPDVHSWLGLSDLLVCASDVESLPRVVLEAMAWELPVLATAVFGLPDVVEDGVTGWLCEERDTKALATALDEALSSDQGERRRIGRAGQALCRDRYRLESYAERMAALLERVARTGEPR
jgi:D-inositol-3-phosphate glycosyltransferase